MEAATLPTFLLEATISVGFLESLHQQDSQTLPWEPPATAIGGHRGQEVGFDIRAIFVSLVCVQDRTGFRDSARQGAHLASAPPQ